MTEFVLTTFDWVPDMPRGYVRDLRIRWALEEAGLPYRVESVSFRDRKPDHFRHQPFGQVPWLSHGQVSTFESGAILLYIAEQSAVLLPRTAGERADVIQWLFAALNSVEMPVVPWTLFKFMEDETKSPGREQLDGFLANRLERMEENLKGREWLTDRFSVADIAMSDVLRLVDRLEGLRKYPACRAYVARAKERPAFKKAYADQMAHFAAADK